MITTPVVDPAALPRVAACVRRTRRARLSVALDGVAQVTFCESFEHLAAVAQSAAPYALIIVEARDDRGDDVRPVLELLRTAAADTPVALYAMPSEIGAGVLATSAISELIVAGAADAPEIVRTTVRRMLLRRSADRLVAAMRSRLAGNLAALVETAIRYPSCATIEALADRLGVHRQTLATWCRNARCLRPEELLVWARLLLVAAVLEQTGSSVTAIAHDLEFPSVVALRNQLKRYTGLTAQEIRTAGLDRVLERFDTMMAAAPTRRIDSPELQAAL